MLKQIGIASLLSLAVVACKATTPPPYEADKAPEDRENYNGAKGLVQQQKDQSYLIDKAQKDSCEKAKLDWAEAQSGQNAAAMGVAQKQIEQYCKE
ncbi:hypothetical protein [Neptunicella marina]|uniref:Lipoprotein n=1 Tax=Neptunicella marina TaxID=2125989 RepID=A0A8J6IR73_9ALTE|nr:hypothetical protein [Neptunicella marina]MBC3766045.1 hypothetical protein [Neptunicella marina]